MKIIFRICLILLAALAVCGGTWLYARSNGTNAGFPQQGEFAQQRPFGAPDAQGNANGQFRPREGGREGRGGGGGGLFGILEVGRPFVMIAVVIAVFSLVARVVRRKPGPRTKTTQSPT